VLYLRLWDVQYGSAAYLKTPNGKNIVQDLGIGALKTGLATFSPLLFIKNRMNVDQLDEVIITHPHADHIKDIENFDTLNPKVLYRPKHLTEAEIVAANRTEDRDLVDKYIEISRRYDETVPASDSPLQTENNGGASIQVFQSSGCAHSNINNHSIVTVISYAKSKVILPGDNDEASWQELLGRSSFKQAIEGTDIFIASHHGMESGFCKDLFEYIHPKLVIISNGRFTNSRCMERYNEVASGWNVHKREGGIVEKKCLTTENDGNIEIAMGWIVEGKKSYLSVTAD
jgi:beta-lactamase superfamily II metal-dependent hydrolase